MSKKEVKKKILKLDPSSWPMLRDIILFFGGLSGVMHETLVQDIERPTLLILFAAMMGLPAFLPGREYNDAGQQRGELKQENDQTR